jgi:LAO/AO transport system kinase
LRASIRRRTSISRASSGRSSTSSRRARLPPDPEHARAHAHAVRARERREIARALDLVDDQRPAARALAQALLENLHGTAGAHRIGLTGAPGAGKSTLLDALVRALRARGETLGILAIDPSSPLTGGALLGDRLRVRAAGADAGVFFRSLAARERLGGLADAAAASVEILGAAFDRVLVETVGVGQSEGEVRGLVDTLVYVANPATGDALQGMKAGVLELPDLFVVNKADLGALAERSANELSSGLALGAGEVAPPVLLVSARDGRGIDALLAALDQHRDALGMTGGLSARRRAGRDARVRSALRRRYGSFGLEAIGGAAALAARLEGDAETSEAALVCALGTEIEAKLRAR